MTEVRFEGGTRDILVNTEHILLVRSLGDRGSELLFAGERDAMEVTERFDEIEGQLAPVTV